MAVATKESFWKIFNSLHRRAGKWILPDPFLSKELNISAFRILNLPQQFTYNEQLSDA